jgi:hypothetical protein
LTGIRDPESGKIGNRKSQIGNSLNRQSKIANRQSVWLFHEVELDLSDAHLIALPDAGLAEAAEDPPTRQLPVQVFQGRGVVDVGHGH